MKSVKNCSIHDTPLELWAVILSYLPVKSVLRFRSVSKSWKSIVEDQNFSAMHLKHCSNNTLNPYFIFSAASLSPLNQQWDLHCRRTASRQDSDIPFPAEGDRTWWHVCGGVDGLFLLSNKSSRRLDDNLLLWNPSIRKSIHLPTNPSKAVGSILRQTDCRLMFDASTDDYKVVMVRYHIINSIPTCSPLVDVFSLKSRSWRKVVDSGGAAPGIRVRLIDGNASVGPYLHWTGLEFSEEFLLIKLISFDITSNKFSYTPLPKDANCSGVLMRKIFVLDSCALGLLTLRGCLITIWAMEISSSVVSYGSETSHSWTQKYQIRVEPLFRPSVFCVQKRDILITEDARSLVLYDLETGNRKLVQQVYYHISNVNYTDRMQQLYNHISNVYYIDPYVESLLLSDFDAPLQHHLQSPQD